MQTGARLEHGEIDKTLTYGRIYNMEYLYILFEKNLWYHIFWPILIAAGMAKYYHDEDKSIPFKYIFSKKKNKYVKTKNNPSLFSLFLKLTFVLYYIAIGLITTLFSIFVGWYYANVYLGADFQNYPWKFFGQMYNFFGSIFIIYLIGSLNFAFWMGILPNTIDKVISLFRLKK